MTTETFPLPTTYTFGKVVGRVIYNIADTAEDVDDKPQARAAAGKVRFTPASKGAKVVTADYPAIVMNGVATATLSSTGRILDAEGRQGIWLTTGIYTVTFDLTSTSDGLRGSLAPFDIEVTAAHTDENPLDLAEAVPPSIPDGAVVQTLIVPSGGTTGQILARSDTGQLQWVDPPTGGGGGASDLADLDDVDTTGATNGQALVYNGTNWTPGSVASSWSALSGKPAVIAAGATQAEARGAIGAGTSNLTIGTGSTQAAAGDHTHSGYAAKSANLSDLSSTATARSNLGLGAAATMPVGTTAGSVKAGEWTPGIADLPAGSVIRSTNAAARPTARTDVTVIFLTDADPSAVMLDNDIWRITE